MCRWVLVLAVLASWPLVGEAATGRQARIDHASSPPNALMEHGYWDIRGKGLPAVDVADDFNRTPETVACGTLSADGRTCLSWVPYTAPPPKPSPGQQAADAAINDPLNSGSIKAVLRALRGRL